VAALTIALSISMTTESCCEMSTSSQAAALGFAQCGQDADGGVERRRQQEALSNVDLVLAHPLMRELAVAGLNRLQGLFVRLKFAPGRLGKCTSQQGQGRAVEQAETSVEAGDINARSAPAPFNRDS
jgi:hypothetical protein